MDAFSHLPPAYADWLDDPEPDTGFVNPDDVSLYPPCGHCGSTVRRSGAVDLSELSHPTLNGAGEIGMELIQVSDRGDGMGPAHPVTGKFSPTALAGESGFLWAINRYVFHPRGYALAVDTIDGQLELWGDGTEPWTFTEEIDDGGMVAFEDTLARLKRAWAEVEAKSSADD